MITVNFYSLNEENPKLCDEDTGLLHANSEFTGELLQMTYEGLELDEALIAFFNRGTGLWAVYSTPLPADRKHDSPGPSNRIRFYSDMTVCSHDHEEKA